MIFMAWRLIKLMVNFIFQGCEIVIGVIGMNARVMFQENYCNIMGPGREGNHAPLAPDNGTNTVSETLCILMDNIQHNI
jgi:hypothetical protein